MSGFRPGQAPVGEDDRTSDEQVKARARTTTSRATRPRRPSPTLGSACLQLRRAAAAPTG